MNRGTVIKDTSNDYLINFEDNESDIPLTPFDAWIIPVSEYNKRGSTILELQNRSEAAEDRADDLQERLDKVTQISNEIEATTKHTIAQLEAEIKYLRSTDHAVDVAVSRFEVTQ